MDHGFVRKELQIMASIPWRKILYWVGFAAGLAGVFFIAVRLWKYSEQLDFYRFQWEIWVALFALALIYGGTNFFLASGWWHVLNAVNVKTYKTWVLRTYGISQVAKYVPGNIMHIAGRQSMGISNGLPGWIVAKSIFWELVLFSIAGLLLSCIALPLLWPTRAMIALFYIVTILVGFVIFFINRVFGLSGLKAFLHQLVFLIVSGIIFAATIMLVVKSCSAEAYNLILFGSGYICAWFIGFITPGAPAGIGIRETVLLFFFGKEMAEADLLLAVIVNRVITALGDGGFFAWAALFCWKK
jgi:hypothetical protein